MHIQVPSADYSGFGAGDYRLPRDLGSTPDCASNNINSYHFANIYDMHCIPTALDIKKSNLRTVLLYEFIAHIVGETAG